MGTNFIFGKISFVTNAVASILQLAMAIDYAIILFHRFMEEKAHTDTKEALIRALEKGIVEISSSSLTTMSGMVALMFMHFGIRHLVNNMLILFVLGDNLERALGKIRYLFFYLTCGVLANVISLLWEIWFPGSRMVVSAGASGAIFGVIGGLLYVVGVNRGRLEDLSSRQLATMVLFSLYFGFTSTGVNNVAHVGGLVSGIVMAWILYRRPQRSEWWMKEEF